jgi:hypothetical protein
LSALTLIIAIIAGIPKTLKIARTVHTVMIASAAKIVLAAPDSGKSSIIFLTNLYPEKNTSKK